MLLENESEALDQTLGKDSEFTSPKKEQASLKKHFSAFINARIQLATIEAKEAAEHAAKKAVQGVTLALCAFFTWCLLLAGLTGLLSPMVSEIAKDKMGNTPGWVLILFALAVLHGIGAFISLLLLNKKPASPLFELSRNELNNDKQWLTKNK